MSPKKPKKEEAQKLSKEEEFAYAYIIERGNITRAAKRVFDCKTDDSACRTGSEYLGKPRVQKIVQDYIEAQRQMFVEYQEKERRNILAGLDFLHSVISSKTAPFKQKREALHSMYRFMGMEAKDAAQKIQANEAVFRPGGPVSNDNRRLTVFHMQSPPIPPGGTPTPALIAQWKEQGVELPIPEEQNPEHGNPSRPVNARGSDRRARRGSSKSRKESDGDED